MGIFSTALAPIRQQRSLENPQTSLSNPDDWLYEAMGAGSSASGIKVNRKTALTHPPFWRAVTLRADTVAKVPVHIYRRIEIDGREGKERYREHAAHQLLRYKANPHMTASVFKKTLQGNRDLKGNGYAFIDRDGAGRPLGLYPLDPESTYPVRVNGVLGYLTRGAAGNQVALRADQVFHIKGLGWDGLVGYPILEYARDSMGMGMGVLQYQSKAFCNGVRPSISVQFPREVKLSTDAAEKLRIQLERIYGGIENTGRAIVIGDGAEVKPLSFSAKDAQMIESAQMSVRDVSNFTGVPPHKLGDQTRNAYNSLEQENQSYLDDTMEPIFVDWEDEARDKLLTEGEKRTDTVIVEFLREALVRADLAARAAYYEKSVGGPWEIADEARARENKNPLPNGQGSKLNPPRGTALPGGSNQEPKPDAKPPAKKGLPDDNPDEPDEGGRAVDALHRSLIAKEAERIVKRIGAQARKSSKTSLKFPDFLESLHDRHLEATVGILDLPMKIRCAHNGADAGTETAQTAARIIEDIRTALDGVYSTAKPAAFVEAIDAAMTTLETELPGRIAADMIG